MKRPKLITLIVMLLNRRKQNSNNHTLRANGLPDCKTITSKGVTVRPGRVIDQTGSLTRRQ